MDNQFLLVGSLLIIAILTVIFAKVIGPKLQDWIAPGFNKATNKLDDAMMGKPTQWEAKVRELVEMIAARFSTSKRMRRRSSTSSRCSTSCI